MGMWGELGSDPFLGRGQHRGSVLAESRSNPFPPHQPGAARGWSGRGRLAPSRVCCGPSTHWGSRGHKLVSLGEDEPAAAPGLRPWILCQEGLGNGGEGGGWLRQGGREGGREAPALLCNFAADAVITGRAPPAWPAGGRQPHTQPPLLPGTPVPSLPPLPSLFGHGGSPLCTPGVWGAGGHGVPSTLQPTLLCACTL